MIGEGLNPDAARGGSVSGTPDDGPTNRERVLEAAARVFAEKGLGASVPAVAAAAGVGVGTIYRAFDSKHDLIGALVADRINRLAADAEKALEAGGDAWEELKSLLWRTAERQAVDYVTAEGLTATYDQPPVLAARERAGAALDPLFDRAIQQGRMRPDFSIRDMAMLFAALAGAQHSAGRDSEAWKRIMGVLIDGLEVVDAAPLPAAPLSDEEIDRAIYEQAARQDL